MLNNIKIFSRPKNDDWCLTKYWQDLVQLFNEQNIELIPKKKIKKCFLIHHQDIFLSYRFLVLKKWMILHEQYTSTYVKRLESVLNKLCLNNELNSYEQTYINNIYAIVFAQKRNLKRLIVEIPLYPNEVVFYKYKQVSFAKKDQIDQIPKWVSSQDECYISNLRICFLQNLNIQSIYLSNIKSYQFNKHYLTFVLKNGLEYILSCQNNFIFYVSFLRMLEFKGIKFND